MACMNLCRNRSPTSTKSEEALGRAIISSAEPARQRLVITHLTAYSYPSGASRLSLLLRLWPEPYAGLSVRDWQVSVQDVPVKPSARTGYGERVALWSGPTAPGEVKITATGTVEVEDRAGMISGLTSRIDPEIFLRTTRRTKADKAIRDLAGGGPAHGGPAGADQLNWLHSLMADVRSRIDYAAGSTDTGTSASGALAAGRGVCQDHAHVFIAAARAHGIPARYVCGYLLAADDALALHETHAWVEVWLADLGWVAFDPSNGICTTDRYVRLCVGLDAVDAAPIRGHAIGGQSPSLYADVRISPVAAATRGRASTVRRQWQSGMQQQ
jgi:transglutaminase-like putative cysteine protease